jgi:hypothetical protein
MFIGHFAVGLAAKKVAPKVSLGTLILSAQLLDLLWPVFLLLGLEHVRINVGDTVFTPLDLYDYPISHSLLTVLGWSVLFAIIYFVVKKYQRGALIVGAGVFSHWFLDFITHRPDLPLAPGSETYVGLGLWNSFMGTVLVEGLLFVAAVILYARTTRAMDKVGKYAYWGLVIFLSLIWIGNMTGPPPPDSQAIAYVTLLMWLFVPWGYWIDRHRTVVGQG